MKFAIVGNPNSGKTTIFNKLTGSNQKVGNWTGVTVDKVSGSFVSNKAKVEVIDLPGIYSLSCSDSNAIDAKIACTYILEEKPDAVINVVDASNIERNLYLTIQLMEMNVPVIIALNMVDIAEKKGIKVDPDKLSKKLRVKVLKLVGRTGVGINELKDYLSKLENIPSPSYNMSDKYDDIILNLKNKLESYDEQHEYNNSWLSIKLLEGDDYAKELISPTTFRDLYEELNVSKNSTNPSVLISAKRYEIISDMLVECRESNVIKKYGFTELVDSICLNKYLGLPIFFIVMYLMFEFTMTIGLALQPLFDQTSMAIFVDWVQHFGMTIGVPAWLIAVLSQGLGIGINTVVTFFPQIACMFLFFSFLEDSGYMARAAFVMDRVMSAIGLPGKAFVPLIMGFGCNVTAVMATRTLETKRDRILTTLMSPFMSCGGRLAIFAVFAGAFFHNGSGLIVFLIYLIGIICSVITGLIFKNTILKGDNTPFIMEMPVYHLPNLRTILITTWIRTKGFLFKAGAIIIPACILIGALNVIEPNGKVNLEGSTNSILAHVGRTITPVLKPMGIKENNWPATVGLVTGVLAKEVVLGSLNTMYSQQKGEAVGDSGGVANFSLGDALIGAWTGTIASFKNMSMTAFINPFTANKADATVVGGPLKTMVQDFASGAGAFAYMLFVLLYMPCVATVAAAAREIGRGWTYLSVFWGFSLAYCIGVIAYQVSLIDTNTASAMSWIIGMLLYLGILVMLMRGYGNKKVKRERQRFEGNMSSQKS